MTNDHTACVTRGGRPAFVVNVEVFLERDGRWLLIRRGDQEAHAPGVLSGVGGKVEADGVGAAVLEETAGRWASGPQRHAKAVAKRRERPRPAGWRAGRSVGEWRR